MDIEEFVNRFEFYAQQNKAISHNPNDDANTAFLNFDFENIQEALRNGLKFPCLFLQTPSFSKTGASDSKFEEIESAFMVLMPKGDLGKAQITHQCKTIADQIYNRINTDAPAFFESQITKTDEGIIGPLSTDALYGWVVTFMLDQSYDAEVKTEDWEDLD